MLDFRNPMVIIVSIFFASSFLNHIKKHERKGKYKKIILRAGGGVHRVFEPLAELGHDAATYGGEKELKLLRKTSRKMKMCWHSTAKNTPSSALNGKF
ncbi:MAG TPA: hypothetical protein DDX29_06870 [Clostridiales bacterium]|nr:hypothetical protein [Clostridiales bacterium]